MKVCTTTEPAPRPLAEICELARMCPCGQCWARPGAPCVTGASGTTGYHVARFGRARRRGLISAADFGAVTAAAVVFCNATVVYDDASAPAGAR